jgi:hypothetical protein
MKKLLIIIGVSCFVLTGIGFQFPETQKLSEYTAYALLVLTIVVLIGIYYTGKKQDHLNQINKLEEELQSFLACLGEDVLAGKTGGYFMSKSIREHAEVYLPISVRTVSKDKEEKCYFLVQEKAFRLAKKIRFSRKISSHIPLTSYESRDETHVFRENNEQWGKWGGAVLVDYSTIYSFSGFPELVDEAFVCWVALQRKVMSLKHFKFICERRANNPHLKKILEYYST